MKGPATPSRLPAASLDAVILVGFMLFGGSPCSASPSKSGQPATEVPGLRITVAESQICGPVGAAIVVRKGEKYGAVAFSNTKPGKAPGMGSAHYDSIYQADGSGSFQLASARRSSGDLKSEPLVGIGRFAFSTGDATVRIGPFNFGYSYPDCLDMHREDREQGDREFQFSAVRAADLRTVDVRDPRLKWFTQKVNRRESFIVP